MVWPEEMYAIEVSFLEIFSKLNNVSSSLILLIPPRQSYTNPRLFALCSCYMWVKMYLKKLKNFGSKTLKGLVQALIFHLFEL